MKSLIGGINEVIGYIISAAAGVAIILIIFKILSSAKKEQISSSKVENIS